MVVFFKRLFLMCLASLSSSYVLADERPLRIATLSAVPPYVQSNPTRGMEPDLLNAIYNEIGQDIQLVHVPVLRMDYMLSSGKVDGTASYRTGKVACFESDTFNYWHNGLSVSPEFYPAVQSISDLSGLVVAGFPNAEIVVPDVVAKIPEDRDLYITLINSEHVYKMLEKRRVDAYIGEFWVLNYLHKNNVGKLKRKPFRVVQEFEPSPRKACFAKRENVLNFNVGLSAIKKSGEYDAIQLKYKPE